MILRYYLSTIICFFLLLLNFTTNVHAGTSSMPLIQENIIKYMRDAEASAQAEGYDGLRDFIDSILLNRLPNMTREEMMSQKAETTRRVLVAPLKRMGYDYEATVRSAKNEMIQMDKKFTRENSPQLTEIELNRTFALWSIVSIAEEMSGFLAQSGIISKNTAALLNNGKQLWPSR